MLNVRTIALEPLTLVRDHKRTTQELRSTSCIWIDDENESLAWYFMLLIVFCVSGQKYKFVGSQKKLRFAPPDTNRKVFDFLKCDSILNAHMSMGGTHCPLPN